MHPFITGKVKLRALLYTFDGAGGAETTSSVVLDDVVVAAARTPVSGAIVFSMRLVFHWYRARGFSTRPLKVRVPIDEELCLSDTT